MGIQPAYNYRIKLSEIDDNRHVYIATFERFGISKHKIKNKTKDKTILLTNIKTIRGNLVCDHMWFDFKKPFKKINLKHGDILRFRAHVSQYTKKYGNKQVLDYRLSHISKMIKLKV